MANTSSPSVATYKSVRIPLQGDPTARSGLLKKDRRSVNFMTEVVSSSATRQQDVYKKKRPGTSLFLAIPGSGQPRGVFYWRQNYFTCVGNVLYSNTTALITLETADGQVGFATFNGTSAQSLLFSDGGNLYVITDGANFTKVTSANLPKPHNPSIISQDGYVFIADLNDNIYNSDLGNPSAWTAGNFIQAEMYPDKIVYLTRIKNYIVAMGEYSTEFFYNPGTIVSGSPIQRNDSFFIKVGAYSYDSVSVTEDMVTCVGVSDSAGLTVYNITAGEKQEIADYTVKQCLEQIKTENRQNIKGNIVRIDGHKLYILNLAKTGFARTFVYDYDSKDWQEWSFGAAGIFPFSYTTVSSSQEPIMQHVTNGNIYRLDSNVYTDFGNDIICVIQTSKIDENTNNYKDFNRLTVNCDMGTLATVPCSLEWSDDDYRTWTARAFNITPKYQGTLKMGKARRRAYRLSWTINDSLRINSIELDLNVMGT